MIPPDILLSIQIDPFLKYLYYQVRDFDKYLDSTSKLKFNVKGVIYDSLMLANGADCSPVAVNRDIEYVHRWTKSYDNKTLWRLYNLKYFYELNPSLRPKFTMMITQTGSHASPDSRNNPINPLNHLEYLAKFHRAHYLNKKRISKECGLTDYLTILEPHPTSGYVHAHTLYFLDSMPDMARLNIVANHWCDTLNMGSHERAFDIEIKEPKDFSDIQSLIAYPLSYLDKSMSGSISTWIKYDVIFNTCLWLSGRPAPHGIGTRVRAFQPSRNLSRIMNHVPDKSGYTHLETILRHKDTFDEHIMYRVKDYDNAMETYEKLGGNL